MVSKTFKVDVPKVAHEGEEKMPEQTSEKWWKTLRLELFMVLHAFGAALFGTAESALYMDRACRVNFNQTEEVCANITAHQDILDEAQREANYMTTYVKFVEFIPSLIVTIFAGPFSDKFGRKPIITIASIGRIFKAAYMLLFVYWTSLRVEFALLANIPYGFTGAGLAYINNIYCMLTEDSGSSARTLRFAIFEVITSTASPLATIIAGQVWKYFGYKWLYGSAVIVDVLALLFVVAFINEKRDHLAHYSWRTAFFNFCNLDSLKDNFRACFKKRDNQGRTYILIIFAVKICLYIANSGISHNMFFFVNKVYGWDVARYTLINNGFKFGNLFLAALIVPFLTKVMKISDSCLAMIYMFILATQCIGRAFAYQPWIFYATSVFESVLLGLCSMVLNAKLSKVVGPNDQGKVFCILMIMENTLLTVSTYIFATIYNNTLDSFPGMVFLAGSAFLVVPILIIA